MLTSNTKRSMSFLSHTDQLVSLYVALFFVMIVVLQLFTFETFPEVLASYDFVIPMGAYQLLASIVVVLEVLAIPFVLGMKLRPVVGLLSQIAGGMVILGWLSAGLYQAMTSTVIENVGLYGTALSLPQGWWLVSYMLGLAVIFSYVIVKRSPWPASQEII